MAVILFKLDETHKQASRKLGVGPFIPANLPPLPVYTRLSGVCKNKTTGTPIAGCTVILMRAADHSVLDSTVSDGSGNYSFTVALGTAYELHGKDPTGLLFAISADSLFGV